MQKLFSSAKKEILILVRDLPGLLILFLMPVLLILVVTLAQDKAVRSEGEATKILFNATDDNPWGKGIKTALDGSGTFLAITEINGAGFSEKKLRDLVRNGDYPFGVILGQKDSIILLADPSLNRTYQESVFATLRFLVTMTLNQATMVNEVMAMRRSMDSVSRVKMASALHRQFKEIENEINRQLRQFSGNQNLPWFRLDTARISKGMQWYGSDLTMDSFLAPGGGKMPVIKEEFALQDNSVIRPSVIQNNVPGFILFAMFFIVIPLSGSIISEKNEGSFMRLKSLPVNMAVFLSGKVMVYLAVSLLQFFVMLCMGLYVFPGFFGLPALEIGHHYMAIAVTTFASALAAIGFGLLVGSASTTHNQAALFGSVMVVLLGVISGTFLPIHLMPKAIQWISHLSPIRWGIDNYLQLFIREGNLLSILPRSVFLVLFFGLAMTLSLAIFARRK